MSPRFIVGADPLTKGDEVRFRAFIKREGGTWWHWISSMWLIRFPEGSEIESSDIWKALLDINPSARIFISAVEQTDWTVTDVRNSRDRSMSDWLETNWMDD